MILPLWRTVWRFLKKLKIELPYNPAIPLLGIYPEKTLIQKDTCGMVNLSLIKEASIYSGEKTASSISGAGKIGQEHVKV